MYRLPQAVKYFFQPRLPHVVFNSSAPESVAKNGCIGAAMYGNTLHRKGMTHHSFDTRREGIRMNPAMCVKQGSIDVEKIGVTFIPAKSATRRDRWVWPIGLNG